MQVMARRYQAACHSFLTVRRVRRVAERRSTALRFTSAEVALQRADAERLLHGSESGIIERDPSGTYSEAHVPVDHDEAFSLTQHKEYDMLEEGEEDADGNVISKRRARASRFMYGDDVAKPTAEEIEEAHEHGDHEVLDNEHDAPALPRH